jgi:DNA-binding transcriptional regulator YiaG
MVTLAEEARAARRLPAAEMRRWIRAAAGISQARIARELGVTKAAVSKWEAGAYEPRGDRRLAYIALLEDLQRDLAQP